MLPGTIVFTNAGAQISKITTLKGILSSSILASMVLLGILPLISKFIINWIKLNKHLREFKKPKSFDYNMIVIGGGPIGSELAQSFAREEDSNLSLTRNKLQILQVNIGKLCNLACHHCHVEAGPLRTERINEKTAERLIQLITISKEITTVDLTGGAPELNSHFRSIVVAAREASKEVIVRYHLTVLFEPGQEDTAYFFKVHNVKVVASLPCYSKENVEQQRGRGGFDKSIEGLKILNQLGYGKVGTGLVLDLVYNPVGAFLPQNQAKLEQDYKKELEALFNIEYNNLYTITNMPINRFFEDLLRQGRFKEYMELLVNNFNPHSVEEVMCRSLISVSHDGELFDCDFNQMLSLPLGNKKRSIWNIESFDLFSEGEKIQTANHCYTCTAGAGSSCGGVLK